MRRKDKEITDKDLINQIIAKAQVCRLGLSNHNKPYIVPISYGFDGTYIYFHTAVEGTKIDYISINPHICFELEHDVKIIMNDSLACKWTQSFYSVIGFGTVQEITDHQHKIKAFNQIMMHYSGKEWDFDEGMLNKTRLWKITIEQLTGKKSLDKTTL
jgi:hypothetical protein